MTHDISFCMSGPYIMNNSNKHVQNPPKPRENLHIDTYVHYHGKMVEYSLFLYKNSTSYIEINIAFSIP